MLCVMPFNVSVPAPLLVMVMACAALDDPMVVAGKVVVPVTVTAGAAAAPIAKIACVAV